jgi:hypothetical protein
MDRYRHWLVLILASLAWLQKSEANCLRVSVTEQSASRCLPLQTLIAANLNLKSEANVETLKKAHWPHSIAE